MDSAVIPKNEAVNACTAPAYAGGLRGKVSTERLPASFPAATASVLAGHAGQAIILPGGKAVNLF